MWYKLWEEDLKNKGFKYFVLKMEDLFESCDENLLIGFNNVLRKYNDYRAKQNKPVNSYWIVNRDEPYANEIKKIIEKNEKIKLD